SIAPLPVRSVVLFRGSVRASRAIRTHISNSNLLQAVAFSIASLGYAGHVRASGAHAAHMTNRSDAPSALMDSKVRVWGTNALGVRRRSSAPSHARPDGETAPHRPRHRADPGDRIRPHRAVPGNPAAAVRRVHRGLPDRAVR